jgi:excinuclease ABC subunit C
VNELDIVFDDSTKWSYAIASPLSDEFDFESIALHELGHAHQLGHIINPNGVMHYSVAPGEFKKNLSDNDIQGGKYVIKNSMSSNSCGNSPITVLDDSNCSGTDAVTSINIDITSGTNPACEETVITFTANATNTGYFPIYEWKINGNVFGTNNSTLTTSNLQNNDKITCSIISSLPGVSGSPATSEELTMLIYPKPLVQVIPADPDSLTASIEGKEYQWYYNGLPIEETSITIKPFLKGSYSVRVTDFNGCLSEESSPYLYNPLGLTKFENQLSAGLKSLEVLGLRGKISIIGIAKRLEEIYYPGDPLPMYLDKRSETLKIIQQLRNEAHRFGITHHRGRRSKGTIKTELTEIKGISNITAEKLLLHFKSVKRIKEATEQEIQAIVGKAKARVIIDFFSGIKTIK